MYFVAFFAWFPRFLPCVFFEYFGDELDLAKFVYELHNIYNLLLFIKISSEKHFYLVQTRRNQSNFNFNFNQKLSLLNKCFDRYGVFLAMHEFVILFVIIMT